MSLINNMLLDLDARLEQHSQTAALPFFDDLHPVQLEEKNNFSKKLLFCSLISCVVIILIGGLIWTYSEFDESRFMTTLHTVFSVNKFNESMLDNPIQENVEIQYPVGPMVAEIATIGIVVTDSHQENKSSSPDSEHESYQIHSHDEVDIPLVQQAPEKSDTKPVQLNGVDSQLIREMERVSEPVITDDALKLPEKTGPLISQVNEKKPSSAGQSVNNPRVISVVLPKERYVEKAKSTAVSVNKGQAPPSPPVSYGTSSKPNRAGLSFVSKKKPVNDLDFNAAEVGLKKVVRPLTEEGLTENTYREALMHLEEGSVKTARNMLEQLLSDYPQHLGAREALVKLMLQQGQRSHAKRILDEGIILHPGHYPFAQNLAHLYADEGDDARALALLENSLVNANDDAEYLGLLSAIYQRAGNYAKAQVMYQRALALKPGETRWWLGLAIAAEAEQDWQISYDAYLRVQNSPRLDRRLSQFVQEHLNVVKIHMKTY